MNTTALIVEMIIIGLQVAIWPPIFLAFVWGFDGQTLDKVEKFVTLLTVIGIAVCYTIGLVVDAFTAWLEDRLVHVVTITCPI